MNNLRKVREKKNMTQRDVALALGTYTQTVSLWETGRCEPRIKTWEKLANTLNVPTSYLMGIPDINSSAKNRIHELRQEKGLTVRELSDLVKIPKSALFRYEKGATQPSLGRLFQLASFFNTSAEYLYYRTDFK